MCLANGRSDGGGGGGTAATLVHKLLLAVGDVLRPGEPVAMLADQQSASSKEEDEGQADSSSSLALGSEDWDSDQEVTDSKGTTARVSPSTRGTQCVGLGPEEGGSGGEYVAAAPRCPRRDTNTLTPARVAVCPPHTRRWNRVPWTWRGRLC